LISQAKPFLRQASPTTFNNLTALEYYYAYINDLSGPIPRVKQGLKFEIFRFMILLNSHLTAMESPLPLDFPFA
jgi:hypothetical protein